jgi:penicillin-binding protein 1C
MGVSGLADDPSYYGLGVAVGGIELSPLEVATLYATLARGGTFAPLRLLAGGARPRAGDPVLSPASTYLTRRALARRGRPGFGQRKSLVNLSQTIHWKTGTSSGRRDAWAVGSGSRYTVAVWLGNLDNSSSAYLVGADAAGPLFFDLVEAVHSGEAEPPEELPKDLVKVAVCAYSGFPTGAACEVEKKVLAKVAQVPPATCPYHRSFEVVSESGLAVGPGCREGKITERRSYLVWPASIRRWLARRAGGLPNPPAWADGCAPRSLGDAPEIIHPPSGHVALLMPGMEPEKQQVPLVAEASDGEVLEWFVDGRFIGRAPAEERLWWTPQLGRHQIVASTAGGRLARRSLEVRMRR